MLLHIIRSKTAAGTASYKAQPETLRNKWGFSGPIRQFGMSFPVWVELSQATVISAHAVCFVCHEILQLDRGCDLGDQTVSTTIWGSTPYPPHFPCTASWGIRATQHKRNIKGSRDRPDISAEAAGPRVHTIGSIRLSYEQCRLRGTSTY